MSKRQFALVLRFVPFLKQNPAMSFGSLDAAYAG